MIDRIGKVFGLIVDKGREILDPLADAIERASQEMHE